MHLEPAEDFAILTEQTQAEVASIAGRGLAGGALTPAEVRRVCGVALHHAQHCSKRGLSDREMIDLIETGLPDGSASGA